MPAISLPDHAQPTSSADSTAAASSAEQVTAPVTPVRRRDLIREERRREKASQSTARHARSDAERGSSRRSARRAQSVAAAPAAVGFHGATRGFLGAAFAVFASALLVGVTGMPVYADPSVPIAALVTPGAARASTALAADAQTITAAGADDPAVARDSFGVTIITPATPPPTVGIGWPVPRNSRIGDRFGWRVAPCGTCSTNHHGVDFRPGEGTPVVAVADGVVAEAANGGGEYGVYLVINHVVNGRKFSTAYAHLQYGSMGFRVGDVVARGQRVGRVGSTGQSTGPHLHFEVRIDGSPIDPLSWLRRYAGR